MSIDWTLIIEIIYFLNVILAIITVFRQPRDIAAIWAWLLVLLLLPVVGFIMYAFVGRQLPKNKLFRVKSHVQMQLDERLQQQRDAIGNEDLPADLVSNSERALVQMFKTSDQAFLARKNRVKIYTDGKALFHDIIEDIQRATSSVNIEFYTFYNDKIGNEILNLLVKKAKAGVEVRVIYDPWGSMGTYRSFFKPLIEAGGYVEAFLARSAILDFRLNFRDHRKIVVVDGKVGYVGGFNIGDQYLGRKEKFGYWRDTHLRITGSGVFGLQSRFFLDWNATAKAGQLPVDHIEPKYFPLTTVKGDTNLQIVSSGPDSALQQIKMGYIKMIQSAHKTLWIQSPYLIPDDSVLDALRISVMAGVDVRIMIPHMPDHPFVYRATQYYAHQLAKQGVKIYYYEAGFLHAKTMVIDGRIASVGSANMDYRSYKLNFEINAFLYDEKLAQQLADIFEMDMRKSRRITAEMFDNQSFYLRFKQNFSRLLSPIL
ncbi:cardiolipin synthase [Secundilactobacillus kimchicus]|uniref:Cardiolipin synthase n=1 Tax=Secundilactobacillus kimchicus JCM 15530 TaxID=1302272 RepID=A0A0R1HVI7_9LACO|nr:cardiolipin synthase [Secundilactobacillus kimchicus]KRK48579.1 phosphatidylserine phosphatidylglycerophosphate cardiolipin synthase-like protein [Secundilactobacillus kimchicus JCM 15530]MBT9671324.1 cardiolipin synthase [Secundilactobacillus kimchicus]